MSEQADLSHQQWDPVASLVHQHCTRVPEKELPVSGKHESEDDKRVEKVKENGQRPKGEPLPKDDPGGKHRKENEEKNGK